MSLMVRTSVKTTILLFILTLSLCGVWNKSSGIHKHLQRCVCWTGDQKWRPSKDLARPQSKTSARHDLTSFLLIASA